MINGIVNKARTELDKGNLWRAKEILQGAIRTENYNVQLFEMLGIVLLRMGDLPEAGRFLFLSGVRRPEYLEPIEIFLAKHRRKKPGEFVYLLPRKARLKNLSHYPAEVGQVLRELGFPEVLKGENGKVEVPENGNGVFHWIACGTIALVVIVLLILGITKLLEMIR